jgi:hypothetical protein
MSTSTRAQRSCEVSDSLRREQRKPMALLVRLATAWQLAASELRI